MNEQIKYMLRVIVYLSPIILFTKIMDYETTSANLNPFILFGIFMSMAVVTLPYDWGLGAYFLRGEMK